MNPHPYIDCKLVSSPIMEGAFPNNALFCRLLKPEPTSKENIKKQTDIQNKVGGEHFVMCRLVKIILNSL